MKNIKAFIISIVAVGALLFAVGWGVNGVVICGVHEERIDAGAWVPNTTNGPIADTLESATNKVMQDVYWFDPSTVQYAGFPWSPPSNWNCGPVKVSLEVYSTCGVESPFVYEIRAQAQRDGSTWDSAFGETVQITDTNTGAGKKSRSGYSGALTVGGSPAAGDDIYFQVYRNASTAGDTLGESTAACSIRVKWQESPVAITF